MMSIVVDVHSHMLPAVDDGADNMDVTRQMIRLSYNEGCRHLFLTPHADAFNQRGIKVDNKLAAIREWLADENIDMAIYQGAEIYVDPEDAEDTRTIIKKVKKGKYPTLNNTQYVLVEFYLGGFLLDEVIPTIVALKDEGYIPVIAHAERYGVPFESLCRLKEMGCLFQMNLCDVYFDWENDITNMTRKLLKEKMFDFVGTDAHGMDRRQPVMREYIDFLYANYDKDYIDGILYKNAMECLKLEG